MKAQLSDGLIHIIILDVSGIYAQIYDQGYFNTISIEKIRKQYCDTKHWHVLVLD